MKKGMKESDTEGVAHHGGPDDASASARALAKRWAGVRAGRAIEPRNQAFRGADAVRMSGRQHSRRRHTREPSADPARSENLCMQGVSMRENREIPRLPSPLIGVGPLREGRGRTPGMYERGKSDRLVVPTKPPNKVMAAEVVEGRGRGEGNPGGTTRPGHRAGSGVPHVPDRVRPTGAGGSGALITSL